MEEPVEFQVGEDAENIPLIPTQESATEEVQNTSDENSEKVTETYVNIHPDLVELMENQGNTEKFVYNEEK